MFTTKSCGKGTTKLCGKVAFFSFSALVVELEGESYTVSESVEAVEICITAVGTNTPCTITQSLQVTFSTTDECAGIYCLHNIANIQYYLCSSDYDAVSEVLTFAPFV